MYTERYEQTRRTRRAKRDARRTAHEPRSRTCTRYGAGTRGTGHRRFTLGARLADTQDRITALEVEIRADVLTGKATLKGDTSKWKAIYMQGRTSWNTKALEGYSAAHPEIERFRKVGEPSVSIRSA